MELRKLFDEFVSRVYRPPLTHMRDSGAVADLSNPLSVVMLVIDFDTEVSMNGIADFIGNSTGRYAAQTVEAFRIIGCEREARSLGRILDTAASAGMTHESIQSDMSDLETFTITSFAKVHGNKWDAALRTIDQIAVFENVVNK